MKLIDSIFRLLLHKHFRTFTKATIKCTYPSTMAGVPDYSYNFIDGVAMPYDSLTDPSRSGEYRASTWTFLWFLLLDHHCSFSEKKTLNKLIRVMLTMVVTGR